MVRRILIAGILAGVIGGVAAAATTEPSGAKEPDFGPVAATFAQRFLDGKHAENVDGMTAEMRAAFGPEAAAQHRAALEAQLGKVVSVGDPWLEDRLQGYFRYRVPVEFAGGKADLRIVVDPAGKVAGFFMVPHVDPPAADAPKTEAPVEQIDVTVGEGDSGLPGTLALPKGDGPFPGVVLVHGSGPQDRDETIGPNKPFRDLAWGLASRGIAVLRYDKRTLARPGSLIPVAATLTVREEVIDDARAALALLRARPEIDASRVFLLGHSLGGTVAPRIAAGDPHPAGVIVLAGSTLPLPEKIVEQTRYIVNLDGTVTDEERTKLEKVEKDAATLRAALDAGDGSAYTGPNLFGAPVVYYRDLEAHDPPAEAAKLDVPILVLQGERDYQVTMRDFGRWRDALAGKKGACLVGYPGLDHLFRAGEGPSGPQDYERPAPVAPRVIDDVAAWILDGKCPSAETVRNSSEPPPNTKEGR